MSVAGVLSCAAAVALVVVVAWVALAPIVVRVRAAAGLDETVRVCAGARLGPLGARVTWADGALGRVDLVVLGVRVARVALPSRRDDRSAAEPHRVRDRAARRRFDFGDLLDLAACVPPWVTLDRLTGHLRYGGPDFALTGAAFGWLCALASTLGPVADLRHTPDWSGTAVLAGEIDVTARIRWARVVASAAPIARRVWTRPRA